MIAHVSMQFAVTALFFSNFLIILAASSLLLANMEREKELLRVFLKVSQMENNILRRLNLSSFLMVSNALLEIIHFENDAKPVVTNRDNHKLGVVQHMINCGGLFICSISINLPGSSPEGD